MGLFSSFISNYWIEVGTWPKLQLSVVCVVNTNMKINIPRTWCRNVVVPNAAVIVFAGYRRRNRSGRQLAIGGCRDALKAPLIFTDKTRIKMLKSVFHLC